MTEGSVRRLEWTRIRVPPGARAGGTARAYVNHGRWVADCEQPYCNGAESLEPRQALVHCSNCHWEGMVQWPPDADAIWEVLAVRPVPQTRNWFPSGHELALRSGCPARADRRRPDRRERRVRRFC